uniref:Phosphotransferase n=1 Tax=Plectus sambesii TaxID=2011161 RepID=A0A914X0H8_9BILA
MKRAAYQCERDRFAKLRAVDGSGIGADYDDVRLIQEICKSLLVSDEKLRELMDLMLLSMEEGLAKETASTAAVKMLPSYVRSVPNGTESGHFLALDLGGTNFRVLLITLDGKKADMVSKIYRIPDSLMKGTGQVLFDHIADCLAKFMVEHDLSGKPKLPLGFTFSFPCRQEGLTCARLINWTKGFSAAGVEGKDVVTLLREACQRRKDVDIDVVAVLNDTTGTLMACAHKENTCQVGVIVGTGTNACYVEKISRCGKLDGEMDPNDGPDEVIINTEWGAFGDDGRMDSVRTEFDRNVDANSINPGKQIFEKMISGMYMGELVRVVLEHLTKEGLLFEGSTSTALFRRGAFPTKYVSEIESDLHEEDRTFQNTFNILEDLGLERITPTDCANVAYVCSLVSARAAHLCAAGIAVLLNRMQKPMVTVGVDGSVYRFHPTFKQLLDQKIDQLVDRGLEFQLMLSEDGSGKGAALVAAVACRVEQERVQRLLAQQKIGNSS